MEREALQQPEMPPAEPRMWPGRRLREAREARHLSRDEVAGQLHQDVQIIQALEEDNYASLPGQTYVLGYLRSYARLLKLPEEEIVAAVQTGRAETAELLPENIDYDRPVRLTGRRRFNWLYLLLVVLIIAGLVALFFGFSLPFKLDDLPGL